jgi:hypothetical protein
MSKDISKKRWDKDEIKKVAEILLKAEKNKGHFVRFLDEIIHWLVILLIILINLILSIFIVLISGFVRSSYIYLIIATVAVSFGLLIDIQLKDIEKIDKKKHLFARIMLIVLATLNIVLIIGIHNTIQFFTQKIFPLNSVAAAIVYGIFFLAPHYIMSIFRKS